MGTFLWRQSMGGNYEALYSIGAWASLAITISQLSLQTWIRWHTRAGVLHLLQYYLGIPLLPNEPHSINKQTSLYPFSKKEDCICMSFPTVESHGFKFAWTHVPPSISTCWNKCTHPSSTFVSLTPPAMNNGKPIILFSMPEKSPSIRVMDGSMRPSLHADEFCMFYYCIVPTSLIYWP